MASDRNQAVVEVIMGCLGKGRPAAQAIANKIGADGADEVLEAKATGGKVRDLVKRLLSQEHAAKPGPIELVEELEE